MGKLKESDMYPPIRAMLTEQGFTVRGEVKGCDIAAVKDGELWLIEMKLTANLKLIFQTVEKQAISDHVFAAIPRPKNARDKHFRQFARVLKKLNIGLITVSLDSENSMAQVIHFPQARDAAPARKTTRKVPAKASALKNEIAARSADTAGGSQEKVNTAYRERCIRIAAILEAHGAQNAPSLTKTHGCNADAYRILRANFYGWFEKKERGVYGLSDAGREYLHENAAQNLVAFYRMKALAIL